MQHTLERYKVKNKMQADERHNEKCAEIERMSFVDMADMHHS